MARPSKRNITWQNFKRSRKSQLKGFVEAMKFAGKSDAEIIEAVKKIAGQPEEKREE